MNTVDVNPNRFLRHWIASAMTVWFVAAVACLLAWIPIAVLSSMLAQFASLTVIAEMLTMIAIFTIPGLTIGYVIGDMQHKLLRDILHWDMHSWIRYSSIGGLLGGFLVIFATILFGAQLSDRLQWMLALPLFMLPISIMQQRILRTYVRETWLWILGNVVGAIVFSSLMFGQQVILDAFPATSALMWLLAAAALGIITGIVMLWLYERPRSDWGEEDAEFARVYVEARHRDERY